MNVFYVLAIHWDKSDAATAVSTDQYLEHYYAHDLSLLFKLWS